jgi:predicted GNAT superfamily acetyltransferase
MPMNFTLHLLDELDKILPIEDLQRQIWPGCETDVVPAHLLRSVIEHGGLLIAAYAEPAPEHPQPIGFVFGMPGFYPTPDGPRLMHYSHMLGILPQFRGQGIAFALKRAQWQMVRHQGVDRICWTYDPLLSINAHLNITRLGAVCNTYLRNYYGTMRDELNLGLPSDRFLVDWWVNSARVNRRLSKRNRGHLRLEQLLSAQIVIANPAELTSAGLLLPSQTPLLPKTEPETLLLVEIPADLNQLKKADPALAQEWREKTGKLFEDLFTQGYLVTDFVHERGTVEHSYYILSYGESTF